MTRWITVAWLVLLFCSEANAQARFPETRWPERPIRVIVPFQPGGIADVIMRIIGPKLGARLGQQIVVDNRVGAGGRSGTEAVARADPDGYTLGFANTSTHALSVVLSSNLSFDPVKDFAPVALIGASPLVLTVNPNIRVTSVKDFIAYVKSRPRTVSYASAGSGTLAHFAGMLFERLAKVEMVHVPYRGTNQAMVDLMEGRIDSQFGTIPPTLQYIRNGKMRGLAVTGHKRSQAMPDVPTLAEAGVAGYELTLWQALVSPSGVNSEIIERLNQEIVQILKEQDTIEMLDKLGVDSEPRTSEDLGRLIGDDIAKWREVMREVKPSD